MRIYRTHQSASVAICALVSLGMSLTAVTAHADEISYEASERTAEVEVQVNAAADPSLAHTTASLPAEETGSTTIGQYEAPPVPDPENYELPTLTLSEPSGGETSFRSASRVAPFAEPKAIGHGWALNLQTVYAGNGDGRDAKDLYSLNSDTGKLNFYARAQNGHFDGATERGSGWNTLREVTGGVDFTGDGLADIVAIDSEGRLRLYEGLGDGKLTFKRIIGSGGWQSMTHILAVSKWGQYGATVVAVRNDGLMFAYPTDGKGTIVGKRQIGHGWDMMVEVLGVSDWTGDDRPDIFGVGKDGKLFLYESTKNGDLTGHGQVGQGWGTMRSITGAETANGRGAIWSIDKQGILWEYRQQQQAPRNTIVEIAKNYLGIPYVWGGSDRRGLDCSGFVSVVYRDAGKAFRNGWRQDSSGIRAQSRVISAANARPGDILYWPGHVAIYIGNGQMIDAAQEGTLTAIRSIYPNPTYLRFE